MMEETRQMPKWFATSDFHKEFLKSRKQKCAQSQAQARHRPGSRAGIWLFPGGEILDHGFGEGGNDLAFVGVIQGEDD